MAAALAGCNEMSGSGYSVDESSTASASSFD
jgi:predicted small secreted protein